MAKWDPWHWPAFTIQPMDPAVRCSHVLTPWGGYPSGMYTGKKTPPPKCRPKKSTRMTWTKTCLGLWNVNLKLFICHGLGGVDPNYTVIWLFATRHWLPHSVGKNPTESRENKLCDFLVGGRHWYPWFPWLDSSCLIFWGPTSMK